MRHSSFGVVSARKMAMPCDGNLTASSSSPAAASSLADLRETIALRLTTPCAARATRFLQQLQRALDAFDAGIELLLAGIVASATTQLKHRELQRVGGTGIVAGALPEQAASNLD